MSKPKLPLGIQTFEEIRDPKHHYAYVDKTETIIDLLSRKYIFLSRPRRFGKSLLISTIKCLFEGKKAYFNGLAAEHLHDWSTTHPVIHLDMSACTSRSTEQLNRRLINLLQNNFVNLNFDIPDDSIDAEDLLAKLIQLTTNKHQQKAVVLIDEYDAPLVKHITQPDAFEITRDYLTDFYRILKANDQHLRFVMLTGVSRFSKVSIFSGLNNLQDISFKPEYAAICGYTEKEMLNVFKDYIDDHENKIDLDNLRHWYDGYSFDGSTHVYNPWDILSFFDNHCTYADYWCSTGMPNMLYDFLKTQPNAVMQLNHALIDFRELDQVNPTQLKAKTLLFQTGYLTIKEVLTLNHKIHYRLGYPNYEVSSNFTAGLFEFLTRQPINSKRSQKLADVFLKQKLNELLPLLQPFYAHFSYHHTQPGLLTNYEGFYIIALYSWLQALPHLTVITEESTSHGRADMIVSTADTIYVLEFKMTHNAHITTDALQQIQSRGYAQKYNTNEKAIFLVAIAFDRKKRNVVDIAWDAYECS